MSQSVADHLLGRLRAWGVEHVFGYPGDGINGLIAELGKAEGPHFVQSRHEEMSAFEAVGYAKFSGRLGVCLATSGPGAIHLLNGLYDAKLDHVPVVAIVGQTHRSAMGGSYQQEVDLHSLFKDVAGAFVQTAMVPEQFPNLIDRAIRTALAERCPTAVIVPADLQEADYSPPGHAFKQVPSSPPGLGAPLVVPRDEDVARAAEVVNAGEKVAVLIGQGARGAVDEVVELAETTRGGIAKALLGKDVIGDEQPFVTGSIGLLGTRPSWEMMRDCDTLVIVGSSLPYSQYLPPFGRRAVQIDIDPHMIGMRYPTEVNLVGDAAETLRRLLHRLRNRRGEAGPERWRERIETSVREWWTTMDQQAHVPADPVNPMLICNELSSRLPENAIVTADSGSAANWYARHLKFTSGMRGSVSGTLATMGCGVPYAIGAKFAHPDRPAIALVGDGAMQMNGLAELITARRYAREWSDPRLVVCVLHNNDLNQVTWELRAMGGSPRTPYSQDLPDVSYAGFAASLGLGAETVQAPEAMGPAWDRALAADGPFVLDVHCDPDIPPIPPYVESGQLTDMAKALASGDPDGFALMTKGLRTKLQEFISPHR
ncbi:thiamine pyrophosphate-requiring protein [Streptomonospora nanhaiensis]|uniref:thiamine pyrophosphate-requiring protein n=1 Tax=Streptomonospora nanhaiensis TaxID=1323731 RepID=UPI001C382A7B|nr:thiamine pyrophosphate-requiring protein [Streptomonospora nanhaiensis]MBV2365062.1 thiamine pyrophosphate-requiring protein [Streptomonospora nanhaiensis]MBX9388269.1 thiamine pyrophosphate-requiring protein [Streptomonospora nanhaiensis]